MKILWMRALVLQMQGLKGSSESEQMFTGLNSSINMSFSNFNYVCSLIRKQRVLLVAKEVIVVS